MKNQTPETSLRFDPDAVRALAIIALMFTFAICINGLESRHAAQQKLSNRLVNESSVMSH